MDRDNETRSNEQPEYSVPTIVDYGDLVELTATRNTTRITDVPMGSVEATS